MTANPTSCRNAQKVRAHECWECGQPLRLIPSLTERWWSCPTCQRRFLILSDRLIIERIPLPAELEGKRTDIATVDGDSQLIRGDGTAFTDPTINGEVWIEFAWAPPISPPT